MLEGLHLANQFAHVAANLGGQHFHGAQGEIRVDDEAPADIDAGVFIVHAVNGAHAAALVGKQRVGYAARDHLGEFFFLPDLVREAAVGADGEHLNIQRLQFSIFDGNCRQFGRSDKGEIARVEADNDPLAFVIG